MRVRLQDPALDPVAKLSLISTADDVETRLTIGQTVAPPGSEQKDDKKEPSSNSNVVVVPSLLKSLHPWDVLAQDSSKSKSKSKRPRASICPATGRCST